MSLRLFWPRLAFVLVAAGALFSLAPGARGLQPTMPDGTPRPDCSGLPGVAQVMLDWRGQNLVGCKVNLLSSRTKIHFLNRDCTTISIFDLPPDVPQQWSILSQPAGANATLSVNGNQATLSLPVAGDYVVGLTVCPSGNCSFAPSPGYTPIPLISSSGSITITALAQLPMYPPTGPALPPSALVPAKRLELTDQQRSCMCQGGGGAVDPQWVTVNNWNGPNDYRLLEGGAGDTWISVGDDPLNHSLIFQGSDFYIMNDINLRVGVDPQFRSLVSTNPEDAYYPFEMGCEVENWQIPERFRPFPGDRVSVWGFWNLDCGHEPFYTEIHPVVGWAVHRERPVRIPDNATFAFDFLTNQVTATAGTRLYVPGIASDLWFNAHTGEITQGGDTALAQPAQCNPNYPLCPGIPPGLCPPYFGGSPIVGSPIQRQYDFNIYLPKNPGQAFAEIGFTRPRAPLYVNISNPYGYPGPDPTYTRMTETTNGVTYEYLRVHLDLRGYAFSTYSRRIEAAWVYPSPDNWGLEQWRVSLEKMDIYNDLDLFTDGDWHMWLMLPSSDQPWTKILDGFGNAHDTLTFSPAWQTGASDNVLQRAPLELDPSHRLGSDLLVYGFANVFTTGFESDGPMNDDPGRAHTVLAGDGEQYLISNNDDYKATLLSQRIAILNNGTLSPTAAAFAQQYLIVCTNKMSGRDLFGRFTSPLSEMGMISPGISGQDPWIPVDPQNVLGSSAALLGDVNHDGVPDMAFGTAGFISEARLFLGSQTGFSPAPCSVVSLTIPASIGFGNGLERVRTLTGVGDVDGDGVPDLFVAAPYYSNNGISKEGAALLFSGAQLGLGGTFGFSNATWFVESGVTNAQFGFSVAAGDVNGDGFTDVVVGAPTYPNSPLAPLGRVFVYLGSSNGLATTPATMLIPKSVDGFSQHSFGYSVAVVDLNHDGFADVIVGAPLFDNGLSNQGAIFVYPGSASGVSTSPIRTLTGGVAGAQFGYAVASAGDVDGDGYGDVLVGAPYHPGSDSQREQGYASLFRGSASGIISTPATSWFGGANFSHFGADLAGVGDLNGDGFADIAIVAPDDQNADGVHGRISYFLGSSSGISPTETWRTWGSSGVAKPPPGVRPVSDVNLDGFDDVLAYDPQNVGEAYRHIQLVLGRGQKKVIPATDPFFDVSTASGDDQFALDNVLSANFGALLSRSGQTNYDKLQRMAAQLQDLLVSSRVGGGNPENFVPFLLALQQVIPPNLFTQYFGNVDLDLGGAFYIDCGATEQYRDSIGRLWLPDAIFLTSTGATSTATLTGTGITVNKGLLRDHFIPDQMLNSERWCDGNIMYQFPVPNNWYTVILYFSENCNTCVGPALGGIGCANCARIFDLEVQGQRLNAYNQADAALPPNGDGLGAIYTATQVAFDVQVTNGVLEVAVLDRGSGNPPENAAIKGIAMLMRPPPGKLATKPTIASLDFIQLELSVLVDLKANLARFLAGELGVSLQYSSDLAHWQTLPGLPGYASAGPVQGASFVLPQPTNRANFYRAVMSQP